VPTIVEFRSRLAAVFPLSNTLPVSEASYHWYVRPVVFPSTGLAAFTDSVTDSVAW